LVTCANQRHHAVINYLFISYFTNISTQMHSAANVALTFSPSEQCPPSHEERGSSMLELADELRKWKVWTHRPLLMFHAGSFMYDFITGKNGKNSHQLSICV
jgi:hypothetical protein